MDPTLKRWSENFFCVLGLGLSLHLALLKYFTLPCIGSGGCDAVIFSAYGSVFNVPIGVYGAILWAGAILVRDETKRGAVLLLLSIGSLAYMVVQFVVLRGFCPYCTAHAVCAWLAFAFHATAPSRWTVVLGSALALGSFAYARANVARHAVLPPNPTISHGPLASARSGVDWLAPIAPRSPALVVSLSCAACLDLLQDLTKHRYADVHAGPTLFFKTTNENRELTTVFVAAVLAQSGPKRDAFLGTAALLLSIKDQALNAPGEAAKQLAALAPDYARERAYAEELLQAQASALTAANLSDTTPLLVPITGKPRPFFETEELFRR